MLSQENKIPLYLQLKESIRSEIVNKQEEAQLLEVPSGEPLFLMKTVIFDQDHEPIHIGKQLIIGEGYKFTFS
jgi:GntR family transcriptional regulator